TVLWTGKNSQLHRSISNGSCNSLCLFYFTPALVRYRSIKATTMNNRQARMFAIASTGISVLVFLILTLDSHRQFDTLTNAENITPEVTHGKDVWHKYNCINCHTLFGEGAYYAPDLTKITQHRGEAYLQAYMRDPAKCYDENKHRRLMPKQNLSEKEISDLIKFLDWVSKVDNQARRRRPITSSGSCSSGADAVAAGAAGSAANRAGIGQVRDDDDARVTGDQVFRRAAPESTAYHSPAPGADMAGPTPAG